MIQAQVDLWSESPEDSRGSLDDHVRTYLEENIPPEERRIQRGSETVDQIDHIVGDLGSYFVGT
jgi:hypothetical protein